MNLVKAFHLCALPAILSLSLLRGVVVVTVALVFNNQVNNDFQYKLIKLFAASTVGFHNYNTNTTIFFISGDFFNPRLHSQLYSL